jgi:hypothetical protein
MLGRSCLEIYSDVSVDPAQLVGKGPEERARIKASKIIEQMKWEHGLRMSKPKTAEEAEREEVYEKLAGMQGSAVDDLRGLERRFYYLAYGRLFIEALERAIPTARAPQLRERILEELEKLENDERYVERLFKWAKLRSGLEAYLAFDRKMRSLLLKARTRPPGEVLEEAEEARAEYERAKLEASTQPIDFEEPLQPLLPSSAQAVVRAGAASPALPRRARYQLAAGTGNGVPRRRDNEVTVTAAPR